MAAQRAAIAAASAVSGCAAAMVITPDLKTVPFAEPPQPDCTLMVWLSSQYLDASSMLISQHHFAVASKAVRFKLSPRLQSDQPLILL
jgi:hypothetical protein